MMRRSITIACAILFCSTIISCAIIFIDAPELVYFNSFESSEDTTGWYGITDQMFLDDHAPDCGEQSLYIGGGCIQPTAWIDLPAQEEGGYYVLSCWAKIEDTTQTGQIILTITGENEQEEKLELLLDDTEWTFYETQKSQYWPANHKLRLEIRIGGLIPAHMFVDCIKIEKIP